MTWFLLWVEEWLYISFPCGWREAAQGVSGDGQSRELGLKAHGATPHGKHSGCARGLAGSEGFTAVHSIRGYGFNNELVITQLRLAGGSDSCHSNYSRLTKARTTGCIFWGWGVKFYLFKRKRVSTSRRAEGEGGRI